MGILSWIIMGLVVGVVAKLVMPGNDPGGFIVTILIGIAGALLGGWVGAFFGWGEVTGFNMASLLLAIGGSIVLLLLYRLIVRR